MSGTGKLVLSCLLGAWICGCSHAAKKAEKPIDPVFQAFPDKAVKFGKSAVVHQPVREEKCSSCHQSSLNAKLIRGKQPELCTGCHKDRAKDLKKKVLHPPFASGDCTSCHDPHSSDNPRLLSDKGNAFCLTCHQADSDALKKAHFGITTINAGCISCHDAHASDKPKLLLEGDVHAPYDGGTCDACHGKAGADGKVVLAGGGEKICFACHSDLEKGDKGSKEHPPFATRKCWTCHWPHATRERALLESAPGVLCRSCHATIPVNGHPTAEHPTVRKGVMNPQDKTKPFDCTSCHEPHRALEGHFLRTTKEKLCTSCHGK